MLRILYSKVKIIVYSIMYSIVFSKKVLNAGRNVFLADLVRSASHFGVCIECSVKYNEQYSVKYSIRYSVQYRVYYNT